MKFRKYGSRALKKIIVRNACYYLQKFELTFLLLKYQGTTTFMAVMQKKIIQVMAFGKKKNF